MFGDVSKSERPAKLCRDPQMVRKEEKKNFYIVERFFDEELRLEEWNESRRVF